MTHYKHALSIAFSLAATVTGQDSVQALEAAYETKYEAALAAAEGGYLQYAEVKALNGWYAEQLRGYLAKTPPPADRVIASLRLTNVLMMTTDREGAIAALEDLDVERASMTELLRAAVLSGTLGLADRRAQWIDAALEKSAPLAERLEAGLLLMTKLVEPERGLRMFDDAMAAAENDEQRASITWQRANATREREDLEDGAYEAALAGLVERFPETEWGQIAKDRLHAMAYEVGMPVVETAGTDLDGDPQALSSLRGQVVLMWFWASWSEPCRAAAPSLVALIDEHRSSGLRFFGVCLDDQRAAAKAFLDKLPLPGPSLFDGAGLESPHALRNNVEHVPHLLLIDREGKIAGLRLALWNDAEQAHVQKVVRQALAK